MSEPIFFALLIETFPRHWMLNLYNYLSIRNPNIIIIIIIIIIIFID